MKVIAKLLWNSKNHAFIGLAMDENEYAFLKDIFEESDVSEPRGAEYILQFLWRDLTSNYDVIGSYFLSPISVDSVFITASLYETMRTLHAYNFRVMSCV